MAAGKHPVPTYDESLVTHLDFKEDADEFKILQLTDTHIGSAEQLDYARKSFDQLINLSHPDMIIFTGDFIWKAHTKELLPQVLAMIDEFKIPYALVFGNHDLEGDATSSDFVKAFEESEYGIFEQGPDYVTGNGNYAINIKKDGEIVYSLIMLDSLRYAKKNKVNGYNYIHDDQVDFYEWNIKGASQAAYGEFNPEENKVVPSLVFYHIPQVQFFECRQKILDYYQEHGLTYGDETPYGVATLSDDAEYPNKTSDEWLYPFEKTKLFDRASQLKSTKAMFVGHLHYNSSNYFYRDEINDYEMELVHGTKTLTTSLYWGCEEAQKDDVCIGGTVISIKADGSYSYDRLASTYFAPEFNLHNFVG